VWTLIPLILGGFGELACRGWPGAGPAREGGRGAGRSRGER
jgi:hypothetical protein